MPNPTMTPVQSSNVAEVGHDGTALYVRFRGKRGAPGPLYRYDGCPAEHHEGLLKTDSPGRYVLDRIRGAHRGEKVDG